MGLRGSAFGGEYGFFGADGFDTVKYMVNVSWGARLFRTRNGGAIGQRVS